MSVVSDQSVGGLLLGVEPGVVAFLVDADVVGVDQVTVFLCPDGELAVFLVDAQPPDWLDPVAEVVEVGTARRPVRRGRVVAAELERVPGVGGLCGAASDPRSCRGRGLVAAAGRWASWSLVERQNVAQTRHNACNTTTNHNRVVGQFG